MIPFAVEIQGVSEEGQGVWVLAVDREGLLTANKDGELAWYPLAECKFKYLIPPDQPKPVMIVQPKPGNGVIALPNRQMRRHPGD